MSLNLTQLTDNDWKNLTSEIQEISKRDENDIYTTLGNALYDLGYDVSDKVNELIKPKMSMASPKQVMQYVADTTPITADDAEEKGKKYMERVKEQLKPAICNNPSLKNLIDGVTTLENYLKVLLPAILAALGVASITITPVILTLAAGAIALLIKIGFDAYCSTQ